MSCIAAALILFGAGSAHAEFRFLGAWGAPGALPGQFNTVDGVAVDARGAVYVVDRLNNRVQKFSAGGRLLAVWANLGPTAPRGRDFNLPYSVAVDGDGHVYVAESGANRIQKLSSTGRFLDRWGARGGDGTAGLGRGEFRDPRGVAVDDFGNVYVVDHGNHRVQKLSPSGRFLAMWGRNGGDGTPGRGRGEFAKPRGVAIDHAGNMYVAEKDNHRIQELSPTGAFIRRWGAHGGDGTAGAGPGELNFPYGVARDRAGDLYVTDVVNNRVQKFTPDGRFLGAWGHNGGDGSPGTGPLEFDDPYGVATDCRSNVYVTDEGNARVQRLGAAGLPAPRCAPVLAVRASRAQRALARGGLRLSVGCDLPCTATVTVRIAGAGSVRARVVRHAAAQPVTVRVALRRAARLALAGAMRAGAGAAPQARVTVTARGFGGDARAVRRRVRIAG